VSLVQQLLGTEMVGCSVAWFDRPVGEATGVPPHVDVQRGEGNINKGITIWLALDLVNRNNGCLHYLRGSHEETHPNQIFITDIETDSDDVVQVEVNPGDAVIHNALTVHWSGGNKSDMPRRAISYFYRNK
jgi:phytanoyl-CoA hydroxylase